ncbi:MAG: BlaI/MecI/CopY family transcriptional regulator [Bacteroidaceae bacterium]|jgi:predicted transcriptional regulator|nr:BlaI/MecI/CopY family transcriptional regulator [Bacteroidaceae bacterium]MDD7527294.1 BlaI/MecI/CopY family transcriptional regulator [Prevotellaceae bacterium]MDY5760288.1 BlaI/MecI/CopY family transcriptional regulator [Bacteroidaceae bacterium]
MKRNEEERQLTKAEMEIMNVLWERGEGMTTHEIIEEYPEPKPAYSTIATFLKILTNKGFIQSRKQEGGGKTFVFTPTISREAYTNRVMKEVKSTFFGNSLKSMLSFFAKQEEVSEKDLQEIMEMIKSK